MTPAGRNPFRFLLLLSCAAALAAATAHAFAAAPLRVEAKRKPADPEWKSYDTRTVEQLVGFDLRRPKI